MMVEIPQINKIYEGDSLKVLKTWPDNFIQCVVSSPPYWGLRNYGATGQLGLEKTPEEYVFKMTEVFGEVKRVLKKDGTCWLNLGDSYSGSNSGYAQDNKASRKGFGGTTLNHHRPSHGMRPKELIGIPWRIAFALQADGWYLRSDIIWSKPNPMPESVIDRPTKSHEYIFLLSKLKRYFYNADAIKELSVTGDDRRPSGSQGSWIMDGRSTEERHGGEKRAFKFNAGRRDNGRHLSGGFPITNGKWSGEDPQSSGYRIVENVAFARANGMDHDNPFSEYRNKRSVWNIPTTPYKGAHFATFPEDIPSICIQAGSRPGDVVLDPFIGSGTVGVVAKRLNRKYLGIELNLKYIEMAEKRIALENPPLLVE